MSHIPDKSRKEWQLLLQNKVDVMITSLMFQMRINRVKEALEIGTISKEEAIENLYNFSEANKDEDNLKRDIKAIFIEENIIESNIKKEKATIKKSIVEEKKSDKSIEIDANNKLLRAKKELAQKKKIIDQAIKRIDDEKKALTEKLSKENKKVKTALEKAIKERKRIEQQLATEREVRKIILKNAEQERKFAANKIKATKAQQQQKQLSPQEVKKNSPEIKVKHDNLLPQKSVESNEPKDQISIDQNKKKPFFKAMLDFLNDN